MSVVVALAFIFILLCYCSCFWIGSLNTHTHTFVCISVSRCGRRHENARKRWSSEGDVTSTSATSRWQATTSGRCAGNATQSRSVSLFRMGCRANPSLNGMQGFSLFYHSGAVHSSSWIFRPFRKFARCVIFATFFREKPPSSLERYN